MVHRIEVGVKSEPALAAKIRRVLKLDVTEAFSLAVYSLDFDPSPAGLQALGDWAFSDPVVERAAIDKAWVEENRFAFDLLIEKRFKPGVTDTVGKTAKDVCEKVLQKKLEPDQTVYSATQYLFRGNIELEDGKRIAEQVLGNPLIEEFIVLDASVFKKGQRVQASVPKVTDDHKPRIETIAIAGFSDQELLDLNQKRQLALNLEELKAIQKHYRNSEFIKIRKTRGLGFEATDAELEVFAQSWSEHCKHKEFNAIIDYSDQETGKKTVIEGLFQTYIAGATRKIAARCPWLVSVFSDNAGVVKFNEEYYFAFKVETHNSPSALDPYGGALTGIVGNNRDVAGVGMGGADLWFNQFYYCLGDPHHDGPLPPKTLHPRQIFEGVVAGVKDGGNKCGIPTINGGMCVDVRFMAKPLVYCGTGGWMKKGIAGNDSAKKTTRSGDAAIMVGGRIGKDGVHGATMSSVERKMSTPSTAVQIGDPIVQKRMLDLLNEARDAGWISGITDCGAGGLSSSFGEMAQLTGGVRLDVSKAPLKYHGLQPWEILLSEAQERMSMSVFPEHVEAFLSRANDRGIEATVLGEFTDSGLFEVFFQGKPLVVLDLEFLHQGVPRKKIPAEWRKRPDFASRIREKGLTDTNRIILSNLDVCSKEWVFRQKDYNVKGGTLLAPIGGVKGQVNNPASLIKPVALETFEAVGTSQGIFPKYSDEDPKLAALCAFNQAAGKLIALGAKLPGEKTFWAACDNFCVPDSVQSDANPDGKFKMAQLVRLCQGVHDYSVAMGIPFVSGKDSMKNDLVFIKDGKPHRISVPPTLLISLVAKVDDYRKTVSIDFKKPGDLLYVIGTTKEELAGSTFAESLNVRHHRAPSVDPDESKKMFEKVSRALEHASSAYYVSQGGLALAISECALAGNLGAEVDLNKVPNEEMTRSDFLWASESQNRFLVTVRPEKAAAFEEALEGQRLGMVGKVLGQKTIKIKDLQNRSLEIPLQEINDAYTAPLREDLPVIKV